MKKRIITLFMALILCFTVIPATGVLAATDNSSNTAAAAAAFSPWAQDDLVVGDTYGIYPQAWYLKDMKAPIREGQLWVLIAGIRCKLLDTGCITDSSDIEISFGSTITVKDVLNAFYKVISGYQYKGSIGINATTKPVNYMAVNGIFTGKEGELALKDRCSIEQACVIATRLVTYVYNTLDATSKGFLWETQYNGNKVYMLGSIHLASYDIYPFSDKMLKAFNSSNALVVEANVLKQAGTEIIAQYGMYLDGTTLKDHVSADTYKKTVTLATALGYTEAQISTFKPWLVYTILSTLLSSGSGTAQELGQAASLGIDMKFTIDAALTKKPLLEIEGYEYQLKMLDSFSAELQEFLLNSTIDAFNQISAGVVQKSAYSIDSMLKYWHDGDADSFLKEIAPSYDMPDFANDKEAEKDGKVIAEFKQKLFTNRDIGMADYIDKLLKAEGSNTYFVVVGSGHYISNHSVIDILKEKGYVINQVK